MKNQIKKLKNQITILNQKIVLLNKLLYTNDIQNHFKKDLKMNNQDNQINVFDITNYIINNFSEKYGFTQMKLQKIIFYIYVRYLLIHNKPLFQENIEAWTYGPVFPNLYLSLKHHYNNLIEQPIEKGDEKKLTDEHKKIIYQILEEYGSWSASQLVEKVHEEEPWQNNFRESDWSLNIISDEDLYKYYGKK